CTAVIAAVHALGELRGERADDAVAAGGIDANRTIDEGFLRVRLWRAREERQHRSRRGGRNLPEHGWAGRSQDVRKGRARGLQEAVQERRGAYSSSIGRHGRSWRRARRGGPSGSSPAAGRVCEPTRRRWSTSRPAGSGGPGPALTAPASGSTASGGLSC